MKFNVEIVLRGNDHATTEQLVVRTDAAAWTDEDVRAVLTEILRAIERAQNPRAPRDRHVALRGFSWIVEPSSEKDGVVIAIEIPMGAAVAGPFKTDAAGLDAIISRILRHDALPAPGQTVH